MGQDAIIVQMGTAAHAFSLSLKAFMVHEYKSARELERNVPAYAFTSTHKLVFARLSVSERQTLHLNHSESFVVQKRQGKAEIEHTSSIWNVLPPGSVN